MTKRKDWTNSKIDNLQVIKYLNKSKDGSSIWLCKCDCGNIIEKTSRYFKRQGFIKSCGCIPFNNLIDRSWRGIGDIGIDFWNKIIRNAKSRNICFDITIEYAWDLFLKQDKKCALSNLSLTFPKSISRTERYNCTASLDRIDNNKGYIVGNVQWVHKKINISKHQLSQNSYIFVSKLININHNKNIVVTDQTTATDFINKFKSDFQESFMYMPKIAAVSGGMDPVHSGHISNINEAKKMGDFLVVILNSDNFLIRKKGYVLLPQEERAKILLEFKSVDMVYIHDDESQFVDKALKILRPDYFCKGGDRTNANMAQCEIDVCEEIHCQIKYGVGGFDKKASSSDFVKNAIKQLNKNINVVQNSYPYTGDGQKFISSSCRTTTICQNCNFLIVCDSSGKAGTKDEKNKIYYVSGPCVCLTKYCPECRKNYTQKFINCVTYNNPSNLK